MADEGAEQLLGTLVAAARRGDAAAWNEIVDRYSALVVWVTQPFGLPREAVDDVAQTVWLRLIEHLGELRDARALPKWIITTARREALRQAQSSRRVSPVDPLEASWSLQASDDPSVEEGMMLLQRREALILGLAELSERQRRLLLLLVHDPPLSYAEISTQTGIPVGAIGPTRARAIDRLRHSDALTAFLDLGEERIPTEDRPARQPARQTTRRSGGAEHDPTTLG